MKLLMEQWRKYLKEGKPGAEKLVPQFWKNGRFAYKLAEDSGNVELAQQFKTIIDKVKKHIFNIDRMVAVATKSPDKDRYHVVNDEWDDIVRSGEALENFLVEVEQDADWFELSKFLELFDGSKAAFYPLYLPGSSLAAGDPHGAKEAKRAYDDVKEWAGVK